MQTGILPPSIYPVCITLSSLPWVSLSLSPLSPTRVSVLGNSLQKVFSVFFNPFFPLFFLSLLTFCVLFVVKKIPGDPLILVVFYPLPWCQKLKGSGMRPLRAARQGCSDVLTCLLGRHLQVKGKYALALFIQQLRSRQRQTMFDSWLSGDYLERSSPLCCCRASFDTYLNVLFT